MSEVGLRLMSVAELEVALGWAAAEGWNPGLADAPAFHAADPEGFLLAEADGEPVGAIAVANHSDAFAFLGLYLCRPEWRRRGIGMMLWRAGLAHAGDRTVVLDGVSAQEVNYARSGFKRTGATIRFEGPRPEGAALAVLRPAVPEDLPALLALDRAATGVSRERFLAAWTAPEPTRATTVLLGADGRARGFATTRMCGRGCKVGPVVAPDAEAALALAGATALGEPIIVDVPEANAPLIRSLQAQGFRETFRTARMYRGPAPRGDGTEQAVATMELG